LRSLWLKQVFSLAHFPSALVSSEEIKKIGTSSMRGEKHPKMDLFEHFMDIKIQNFQVNKKSTLRHGKMTNHNPN
jgi:hypothetical protein